VASSPGPARAAAITTLTRSGKRSPTSRAVPSNRSSGSDASPAPRSMKTSRLSRPPGTGSARGTGLTAHTSQRSSAAGTRARKAAGPPASMIRSWPPARNLSAISVTGKPSRSRGARASTAASECDPAFPASSARATGRPIAPHPMRPTRFICRASSEEAGLGPRNTSVSGTPIVAWPAGSRSRPMRWILSSRIAMS